ncbi:hypothetical protein F0562_028757 [Nyssa sinensis]|uniref:Btz domain-containing protein n=1 Tax=Nyssa sinensis TaxID=561372 RepID=A0A5J5B0T5_9ASTE|nr:hypothetical protein F0562_028757 [Nyssa sinensis]
MSRREGREFDSKRHRSRFDREPSPKRSRRDGKLAAERPSSNIDLDTRDHSDQDQKHHHRLQDALPVGASLAPNSKVETRGSPRSRSYFQHDERGKAGQGGRSFSRRAATEHGWWGDSKDQQGERAATFDMRQRDERSQTRRDDNHVWRHDGFFEMEKDPQPPAKKRPSFREKKIPVDSENADKPGTEPVKPIHPGHPVFGSERIEERGSHHPRHLDRPEKPFPGR